MKKILKAHSIGKRRNELGKLVRKEYEQGGNPNGYKRSQLRSFQVIENEYCTTLLASEITMVWLVEYEYE